MNKSLFAKVKNTSNLDCEIDFYTGPFEFGYHVPYPSNLNRTTVTLFRKPYHRIISSFLYGKGIHSIMFPIGFPNRVKVKFALRANITGSTYPVLTYARLPGIASCQIKMVLGRNCGENVDISKAMVIEARRRIRYDMAFVGLTEESDASSKLFVFMFTNSGIKNNNQIDTSLQHQIHGDIVQSTNMSNIKMDIHTFNILQLQSSSTPRKNQLHTLEKNIQLEKTLRVHNWKDEWDEIIYKEAAELFFERCHYYGIETKHTLKQLLEL